MAAGTETIIFGFEHEAPMWAVDDFGIATFEEWKTTTLSLCRRLEQQGFEAYAEHTANEKHYNQWCVSLDSTMDPGQEMEMQRRAIPIEIKSPKIKLDDEAVPQMIEKYWKAIEPALLVNDVDAYKRCATHYHFSISPMAHALEKILTFAFIYCEKDIDDIMPNMTHEDDTKRRGGWKNCREYTARVQVKPGPGVKIGKDEEVRKSIDGLRNIWKAIKSTKNHQELHELVNFDTSYYRREHGKQHKNFKVNINGLKGKTIEFRQWYPARSKQEMMDMTTFLREFLAFAMQIDSEKLDRAATGEILFAEAMGRRVAEDERETFRYQEEHWQDHELRTTDTLSLRRYFMPVDKDPQFWNRLDDARDRMETDLAALNEPR
ncbi:hypothetical protein F5Y18DRAFT_441771 [Xylariaceae sp. FL1019]|nr:hypothetical protein F5Y18DRAFT_441771 [Xylariaceae sp. FL1019]